MSCIMFVGFSTFLGFGYAVKSKENSHYLWNCVSIWTSVLSNDFSNYSVFCTSWLSFVQCINLCNESGIKEKMVKFGPESEPKLAHSVERLKLSEPAHVLTSTIWHCSNLCLLTALVWNWHIHIQCIYIMTVMKNLIAIIIITVLNIEPSHW